MKKNAHRENFPKGLRMDLACNSDGIREAMACVYFENGYAYATDGHVLVRNKLDTCTGLSEDSIKMLEGKKIHRKTYKQLLKYDKIKVTEEGIEASKKQRRAFFYFDYPELPYPKAEQIIKDLQGKELKPLNEIAIRVDLLNVLNEAMFGSSSDCIFNFTGDKSGILVHKYMHTYESYTVGVIMPLDLHR